MIPVAFDYAAPESIDETLALLEEGGEDAKLLAGGQSLLPLMKLRLAAPAMLVDLRRVPGLSGVERDNGTWRIGSMTRYAELQTRGDLGLIAQATSAIADQQVRNRGTIGGSLAHGDPASDLPAVAMACEASVTVSGPGGGREVAAADLFTDYLTTDVRSGELITAITVPALDGYGFGFQKFSRRREDWALAGSCALVRVEDGVCADVRIGLTHMASIPLRATAVENALRGQPLTSENIAAAAEHAAEGTSPPGDLHATPEYKRHLSRVLTRRAIEEAAGSPD